MRNAFLLAVCGIAICWAGSADAHERIVYRSYPRRAVVVAPTVVAAPVVVASPVVVAPEVLVSPPVTVRYVAPRRVYVPAAVYAPARFGVQYFGPRVGVVVGY